MSRLVKVLLIIAVLPCGLTAVTQAFDWSTAQSIVSGLGPDTRSNSFDIDIAVDSEGAWHLVYFELTYGGADRTYEILYKNSHGEQAILAQTSMHPGANGATSEGPTIAIGPDGSCHVAYRYIEFASNEVVNNHILYTNNISGSWSTPQSIVTGLDPVTRSSSLDIDIAVDEEGSWHLVYTERFEHVPESEDITVDMLYANSELEAATLAHSVLRTGGNGVVATGPTIAIGPDGSCHVAYRHIDFVSNDVVNNHILYTNNISGSWSTPQPVVSGLSPDTRSNALDIDIAIDEEGSWHLVYTEQFEHVPESNDNTVDMLYANSESEAVTLAHSVLHTGGNGRVVAGPSLTIGPDGGRHMAYRHIDFVSNGVINNNIMYKHRISPTVDALVLEPDPVFSFMTNAIDPITATIFIGDEFAVAYDAADINTSGLLINHTTPATATVLTTHPLIEGEALAVSFPLNAFADDYGLVWDTTIQAYQVTGEFYDATPFTIGDEFFFLGRVSGDMTLDGRVDISDLVLMVEWYFDNGPPPVVVETADVDASGSTDISDVLYLVDHIFNLGPAPQHP